MTVLNQVEYFQPVLSQMCSDPDESVLMECGRLIHAAVISPRFLKTLLANPIKTIDDGFCGEKFSFTREEKQQIKLIQADTLAEFSNMLIQAVKLACRISTTSEISFAHLETRKELSA
jgi:hypothetical protein